MKNYIQTVAISTAKEDAFYALTRQVEKCWGTVDKPTNQMGDIFKVSFGEAFWTFKVIKLQEFDVVSWECIESNQVHNGLEGIEEEWLGTKLHWKIHQKDDRSIGLSFEHEGLVPDFVCYDICSTAWDFFITDSLKNYLESGKGKPG